MKTLFQELFEYNRYYNDQFANALLAAGNDAPEKAILLFDHTQNAHQIWNSRILGDEQAFGVWQTNEPALWKQLVQRNFDRSVVILEEIDLQQNLPYKTSKGDAFENKIQDILFHIINHSTYHRGQIATALKHIGIEPLVTDYVFYKRMAGG